jgi:hypothetical protein
MTTKVTGTDRAGTRGAVDQQGARRPYHGATLVKGPALSAITATTLSLAQDTPAP